MHSTTSCRWSHPDSSLLPQMQSSSITTELLLHACAHITLIWHPVKYDTDQSYTMLVPNENVAIKKNHPWKKKNTSITHNSSTHKDVYKKIEQVGIHIVLECRGRFCIVFTQFNNVGDGFIAFISIMQQYLHVLSANSDEQLGNDMTSSLYKIVLTIMASTLKVFCTSKFMRQTSYCNTTEKLDHIKRVCSHTFRMGSGQNQGAWTSTYPIVLKHDQPIMPTHT